MTGIENPAAWAKALQAANQALALREEELAALAAQLTSRPTASDVAAAEARVQTLQAELEGLIASQRDHLAALESLQRERESAVQANQAQEKLVAESLRAQAEREHAVAAKLEWLYAERTAAEDRIRQQHLQELDHERQRYESLLAQGNGAQDALQQQLRDAHARLDAALHEAIASQKQLLTVSEQHANRLEAWRQAADEASAQHAATLEWTHRRHRDQLAAYNFELAELRTTHDATTVAADERLHTFIAREKEQRESFETLQQALITSHERQLSQIAAEHHTERNELSHRLATTTQQLAIAKSQTAALRIELNHVTKHWIWRWSRFLHWHGPSWPNGPAPSTDSAVLVASTCNTDLIPTAPLTNAQTQATNGDNAGTSHQTMNRQNIRPADAAELLELNGVEFVKHAYRMVLGREPDPVGLAGYLQQLRLGLPRDYLLLTMTESREGRERRPSDVPGLTEVLRTALRERPSRLQRGLLRIWAWLNLGTLSRLDELDGRLDKLAAQVDAHFNDLVSLQRSDSSAGIETKDLHTIQTEQLRTARAREFHLRLIEARHRHQRITVK